jgi:hypothetical protein
MPCSIDERGVGRTLSGLCEVSHAIREEQLMSEEKKKDLIAPEPKKKEEADPQELGPESLDGVAGGLAAAIPGDGGATPLPSFETAVCISQ